MQKTPLTAPLQKLRNEVHASTFLRRRGVDVVPMVGVYSTEVHPFGLVYEYMDGLDLRQFLRNEPNAGRLKLVLTPICYPPALLPPSPTVAENSLDLGPDA